MGSPFDLERFAPNRYFEWKRTSDGATYRVLADPDVDQVARMLRIEQTINAPENGEQMAAAMVEGKQVLIELIQEADPDRDIDGFKVGGQELLAIFAGVLYGESVAQAVLEGIAAETPDHAPDDASGDPDGLQHDDNDGYAAAEGADTAPFLSERPSPEPSSPSDGHADIRQAIGTG